MVEQVDRDQTIGHAPDHLVATPADRGELAVVVEQAERLDRGHRVDLAVEKQRVEHRGGIVLDPARGLGSRMRGESGAHDVEGVAITVFLGVKPLEELQRLDLGRIAAPSDGEQLERVDRV